MLRDDVRRVRIERQLDSVLQKKLSSLQTRKLELVGNPIRSKESDALVQSPMLCPKRLEVHRRMVVVHRGKSSRRRLCKKLKGSSATCAKEPVNGEMGEDNLFNSWFITFR